MPGVIKFVLLSFLTSPKTHIILFLLVPDLLWQCYFCRNKRNPKAAMHFVPSLWATASHSFCPPTRMLRSLRNLKVITTNICCSLADLIVKRMWILPGIITHLTTKIRRAPFRSLIQLNYQDLGTSNTKSHTLDNPMLALEDLGSLLVHRVRRIHGMKYPAILQPALLRFSLIGRTVRVSV